jgi:bifunctional DNA-binding transcriptional regulator/antitoxin component of YhaV-PrlF toxin-antitoxin module
MKRLVPNGLIQPPPAEELQVFPARVRREKGDKKYFKYAITIPRTIAEALGLQLGSLLEVAVRVIDERYCEEAYGYVPLKPKGPRKSSRFPRVACPVCGRPGALLEKEISTRGYRYRYRYIRHARCDGFDRVVWHYIGKGSRVLGE